MTPPEGYKISTDKIDPMWRGQFRVKEILELDKWSRVWYRTLSQHSPAPRRHPDSFKRTFFGTTRVLILPMMLCKADTLHSKNSVNVSLGNRTHVLPDLMVTGVYHQFTGGVFHDVTGYQVSNWCDAQHFLPSILVLR